RADPGLGLGPRSYRGAQRPRHHHHRRSRRANLASRMDDLKWIPGLPVIRNAAKEIGPGRVSHVRVAGLAESLENTAFAQFPGVVQQCRGGMGELIWFSGGKELE